MNSMTGMGRAKGKIGSSHLLVEIKSTNHKYCEIYHRLPARFQMNEIPITQLIKKRITRGKIDLSFYEERVEVPVTINKKMLKNYYGYLKEIKKELHLKEAVLLSHIQAGSSFWMNRDTHQKIDSAALLRLVDKALLDLIKMRKREGTLLKKNLFSRLKNLEKIQKEILLMKDILLKEYHFKLKKRVSQLIQDVNVDPYKLANEVAFFADRSDVTEELDRLTSHFSQMRKVLNQATPCGRPLDFLIQEMNREWNTIGSKSQDVKIAYKIVQAKSELEKIREQVQNIE